MKKYRISKSKLYEILKPAIPVKPLKEITETHNEVQNELTETEISDNGLVVLCLLRDTKQYHQELILKGLLHEGKLTDTGEAILNENIERLKKLL